MTMLGWLALTSIFPALLVFMFAICTFKTFLEGAVTGMLAYFVILIFLLGFGAHLGWKNPEPYHVQAAT